jgi:predicted branched-subunit amino acid permease
MSAHPLTMVDRVISKEGPASAASAIRRSRNGVVDWDGLRDVLPILVGLAPFAVVIGVALSQLQIPHALGVIASGLVYAGSAQLAAMNLIGNGADVVTILVTVAVINARLLMYGAALEPRFRDQSRLFRWLAPHFIVDQTYALAFGRPELAHDPARFLRYWLTVAGAITAVWLGVISLSLFAGVRMSAESPLMIAAPAIFIGMLVPKLAHRRSLVAAATAAIVSSAGAALPNGLGLLTGIVVGMTAGTMVDGRRQS